MHFFFFFSLVQECVPSKFRVHIKQLFLFLKSYQIKDSDPIKQFSLENMLRENLKACASLHGEASFNAAIGKIHPSAFAQLQQALKMA